MLVHDTFCSTQTQFLLQMNLPIWEMTRIVQATSKADTLLKKKEKKKRNLPLVSDLDVVGGLSTNMRPL
jgi:hypothetical protein